MTPQQIDAMKLALEVMRNQGDVSVDEWIATEKAIKEALAEHAMRETQRLGQEIEQEPVAWQWLGSAHFRKKLPKNADITAWNPLYTTPPQRTEQEPVAYYLPHKGFYWAKPTSISAPTIADVEPLPLYTHPPKETK